MEELSTSNLIIYINATNQVSNNRPSCHLWVTPVLLFFLFWLPASSSVLLLRVVALHNAHHGTLPLIHVTVRLPRAVRTAPMSTVILKYIDTFVVLMMVMESTSVQNWPVASERVDMCWLWRPRRIIHNIFILKPFSDPRALWMDCHPGRDHCHQDRHVSSQDKGDLSEQLCILFAVPFPLRGQAAPNHQNIPRSMTGPSDPLAVRVKHSSLCCSFDVRHTCTHSHVEDMLKDDHVTFLHISVDQRLRFINVPPWQ